MSDKNILNSLNRTEFMEQVNANNGLFLIKFTASWCGPCKTIAPFVNDQFSKTPDNVTCANIDVDDNFDLFAFMKSKKMIKGVPAILAYKRENKSFSPDMSVSGSDQTKLISFFQDCVNYIKTLEN